MAEQIAGKRIDNTRLVEAIQALRAEQNATNSHALTAALTHPDTLFLLPTAPDGKGILTLNAPDGKHYLPAYTGAAEMRKNPSLNARQRVAVLGIEGYAKLLAERKEFSGVIIDPQGANFPLSPALLEKLRERKEARNEPIRVLSPVDGFSNDMTKAVGKALYKVPEVDSCFLRIVERGEAPNLRRNFLFVVEYYGEDLIGLAKLIQETCKPFLTENAGGVDVTLYSSELGKKVTEKGDPFFRRQMLWV